MMAATEKVIVMGLFKRCGCAHYRDLRLFRAIDHNQTGILCRRRFGAIKPDAGSRFEGQDILVL